MDAPLRVGFAGMTHLGLVSSTVAAAKGFQVVCYDPDPRLIADLDQGRLPVTEPGLDEMSRANRARQSFTDAVAELSRCDLVYVSADVATDEQGTSDLTAASRLIADAGQVLSSEAVLVVLSQIPPGFMRSQTAVEPSRLFYQVETLIFGEAVARASAPERIIIGASQPDDPLPRVLRRFLDAFACPLLPMRYESAELTKIAINCFLVSSISTTNTLAELCERIHADWGEIAPALRLDRRIGPHAYLKPGLGIAGGNLERDLRTVLTLADRYRTNDEVVRAWLANSEHRLQWAAEVLAANLKPAARKAKVGVWGLAYKENTRSVKNSPSLATIARLPDAELIIHDPVVSGDVVHHPDARFVDEALDAVENVDALLVMTPWAEYRGVAPREIARRMSGRLVVDPYGVFTRSSIAVAGLDHITLGAA